MSTAVATRLPGGRVVVAAGCGIAALFLLLRIFLLLVREPFFDELFTVWISALGFGDQLRALLLDSGPPLYYALVRAVTAGDPALMAARIVSLACGTALLLAILAYRPLGQARVIAALLLAVFPPHVWFSAEARSYALCALLVGIALLALDRWLELGTGGERAPDPKALAAAAGALVLAAYSHYYGVLFFPLPFLLGLTAGRRRALEGLGASITAGFLFLPGFHLASRQPGESIAWMAAGGEGAAWWDPLLHLSFAAPYPRVFVTPPPEWLQFVALAVTVAIVAAGFRSVRARRWGVMTLVPVAVVVIFTLAGERIWFPMRFESVLAAPLVIWIALSLGSLRKPLLRGALIVALLLLGFVSSWFAFLTAASAAPTDWRRAASWTRGNVPESVPVFASGYAYLEVLSQRDASWSPRIGGFPREIEQHPGWVQASASIADPALWLGRQGLPAEPFAWIGPVGGWEREALELEYELRPIFRSGQIGVFRAEP